MSDINTYKWRYYPTLKCTCGGSLMVFTDPKLSDGYAFNLDSIQCRDCGQSGQISVDYKVNDPCIIWEQAIAKDSEFLTTSLAAVCIMIFVLAAYWVYRIGL